ncbi:retrovirus-related pol polyprotein from transposon TNT 1-94 [Tanacetum coccineum]
MTLRTKLIMESEKKQAISFDIDWIGGCKYYYTVGCMSDSSRNVGSLPRETIESYYTRFYKMMNEMIRNNLSVATMQVNVQFLQQLQPEWSRFVTIVKQQHKLDEVSYHKLFDILKQYQKEVNELRAIAGNRHGQECRVYMIQRQRDISKQSHLHTESASERRQTSSNTRNKNVDTTPRYKNDNQTGQFGNQRAINVVGARETVGGPVVQQSGIQCFNCKEFGHYAKECRKPKRDEGNYEQGCEAHYRYMAQRFKRFLMQTQDTDADAIGTVKKCLMPLALKTQDDSLAFIHELKKEMHADLKYVESLEDELDELESDKARNFPTYETMNYNAYIIHKKKHSISLEIALQECQVQLKNDKVCKEKASNVFRKEREQYVEIQDLKAQLQDKNMAISELKKLVAKCKGKSVDTKFDKPLCSKPNAQEFQKKPSVLGKPAPFSNSLERKYFAKKKSVLKTNESESLSKPVTLQNLPQTAMQAVRNTNVIKPGMYRIASSTTQTRAPQSSNANAVCATCGKCVFNSNHDACVSKYLNDVNARTKKPNVVPISTRKPKRQANKSVATPHKKTVASESTTTSSKSYYRMLYKKTNCTIFYSLLTLDAPAYDRQCSLAVAILLTISWVHVRFGNDQFAPNSWLWRLIQGETSQSKGFTRQKGLNHFLFSVGQFVMPDLAVRIYG